MAAHPYATTPDSDDGRPRSAAPTEAALPDYSFVVELWRSDKNVVGFLILAFRRIQIYTPQKIINYASVKKRGRLPKGSMRRSDVTSQEASDMKSFLSNTLLVMIALPNHDRPVSVPVVIIISVTVKKDST